MQPLTFGAPSRGIVLGFALRQSMGARTGQETKVELGSLLVVWTLTFGVFYSPATVEVFGFWEEFNT